jgi:glycosyltransferase involved in cell wall biosynthesis
MMGSGTSFLAQYLRVHDPFLVLEGAPSCEATIELPGNSRRWLNLVVDIYFRESPSHPDRHIGWWLWRWEGRSFSLQAEICRDAEGGISVAVPVLGPPADCWVNESFRQGCGQETLLVHFVLRDITTSALVFIESLYLFQDAESLHKHRTRLQEARQKFRMGSSIVLCWPLSRRVALLTETFEAKGSIGRFLADLCGILNANGIECDIYAGTPSPDLKGVVKRTSDLLFEPIDEKLVVLYNHSIHDSIMPMLRDLPCAKVLFFHNVTPPNFYMVFDAEYARCCGQGLEQLQEATFFARYVANSAYSARILSGALGASEDRQGLTVEDVRVCPPLVLPSSLQMSHSTESDFPLPEETVRLLFVGRLAPHKRIEDLFAAFREYFLIHDDSSLMIVGQDDCGAYIQYLQHMLSKFEDNVKNHIYIFRDVDDACLRKMYRHASAFVCMSEHEGFCIPLVEAMIFDLPIFAFDQPAVAETTRGCGVLFRHKDFKALARTIRRVLTNPDALDRVLAGQRNRLRQIQEESSGRRILDILDEAGLEFGRRS